MSLNVTRTIALWMLPFFALRGMVPAGYMLDVSGGKLAMALCSGIVHSPPSMGDTQRAQYQHHGQSNDSHHGGHEHQKHGDSMCPFAVAAAAVTASNVAPPPVGIDPAEFVDVAETSILIGLSGPLRAQQSRAPPFFS